MKESGVTFGVEEYHETDIRQIHAVGKTRRRDHKVPMASRGQSPREVPRLSSLAAQHPRTAGGQSRDPRIDVGAGGAEHEGRPRIARVDFQESGQPNSRSHRPTLRRTFKRVIAGVSAQDSLVDTFQRRAQKSFQRRSRSGRETHARQPAGTEPPPGFEQTWPKTLAPQGHQVDLIPHHHHVGMPAREFLPFELRHLLGRHHQRPRTATSEPRLAGPAPFITLRGPHWHDTTCRRRHLIGKRAQR